MAWQGTDCTGLQGNPGMLPLHFCQAKEWSHAVQAVQQDLKALAEEKEQLKEDGSDGRQVLPGSFNIHFSYTL